MLYGGETWGTASRSTLTDTWEWDGVRWQTFDAGGPGARAAAVMAYDEARSQLVLFGGAGVSGRPGHVDETWTWNGVNWSLIADAGPGQRLLHSMSFDPRRRQVLLFGGDSARPAGDTWAWDGAKWTALTVPPGPVVAWQTQMVTNRRTGDVLLYTGEGIRTDAGLVIPPAQSLSVDNLWRLDRMAWTRVANTVPGPSTVGDVSAAWSDDGFVVLLDALNRNPQTWVWDGTWHGLDVAGPPQRFQAGAATATDGGVVICGGTTLVGNAGQPLGDCWWFGL